MMSTALIAVIALIGLFIIIIIVLSITIAVMCRRRSVQRVDFGSKGWRKKIASNSVWPEVEYTGHPSMQCLCTLCNSWRKKTLQ